MTFSAASIDGGGLYRTAIPCATKWQNCGIQFGGGITPAVTFPEA